MLSKYCDLNSGCVGWELHLFEVCFGGNMCLLIVWIKHCMLNMLLYHNVLYELRLVCVTFFLCTRFGEEHVANSVSPSSLTVLSLPKYFHSWPIWFCLGTGSLGPTLFCYCKNSCINDIVLTQLTERCWCSIFCSH